MKILIPSNLKTELSGQTSLVLDTNIFIGAIGNEELLAFIRHLRDAVRCSLLTIPSVVFEFTRGSQSSEMYEKKAKFLEDMVDGVFPIEEHMNQVREFVILMQKLRPRGDYTDFLLCIYLYYFRTTTKAYLVTSDHGAMPSEIFDRNYIVTTDSGKAIQNIGIYSLSQAKLDKIFAKTLLNAVRR